MGRARVFFLSGALSFVSGCAWTLRDARQAADSGDERAPSDGDAPIGDAPIRDAADERADDRPKVPTDTASEASVDVGLDGVAADGADAPDGSAVDVQGDPLEDEAFDRAEAAAGDLGTSDGGDARDGGDAEGGADASVADAGDAADADACPSGLARCGAACVDVTRATAHCGACNARCGCGQLCAAGRCAPAAPIRWHPLDRNALDVSGGDRHGVVTGTSEAVDRLGRGGGALRFDGDDAVSSASSALPTGNAPRALSVWFRTATHTITRGTVAGWGGPDLREFFGVTIEGSNVLATLGGADLRAPRVDVSDDRWHHAVVSHDGAAVAVYVDGAPQASAPRALVTVATDLFVGRRAIGSRPVANDFFDGSIDDVRAFDRALDDDAVRDLYRGCSPDDRAPIVFSSTRDGNRELYLMHADGGGQRRLTDDPAEDTFPRWSRDGRRIAFVTRRFGGVAVATMALDGGAVTRVAGCGGVECQGLSWSPDDRWVYYHQRESCTRRVMRAPSDGGGAPEVAYGPSDAFSEWADLSPDGATLALSFKPDCRSGLVDIVTVPIPFTMGSPRAWPLEPVATDDSHPRWSPDGERILWTRGQDDLNVCVSRRAESIACPVRTTAHEFNPAWGPDGAQILFARQSGDSELYLANVDGSGQRPLTDNTSEDGTPDWRMRPFAWVPPIVFESNRDGNPEIYVMNPDGSGQRRLTNNTGLDALPLWSHAGTQIAFASVRAGGAGVYVMNADGSDVRLVVANGDVSAWSQDDEWVYFTRASGCGRTVYRAHVMDRRVEALSSDMGELRNPDLPAHGGELVFARQDCGARQTLDLYRAPIASIRMPYTRLFEDPDGSPDDHARLSPDARRVAWIHVAARGGDWGNDNEIYVMNTDGSGVLRLTRNAAEEWRPAWSPDGREIVFESNRDGNPEIYVMNADGSAVRRLTTNPAADRAPHWRVAAP